MKIIRDIVHGYIKLQSSDAEIIDTPLFQRLKRIRQTSSYVVYPNANHTRFEHSLGVMSLGHDVFCSLASKNEENKEIDNDFFEKYKNTVRYACLLHDIGHAPLSHVCEEFYNPEECKNILKKEFHIEIKKGTEHELMSCAIALTHFKKKLEYLKVDTELFCRMITGSTYGEKEKMSNEWKLNILIAILNSSCDVDKLDYVIRDGKMSGGDFITLDKDRIIESYTINKERLVFSSAVLSTISNMIYGREALYMWVYNHHIVVYIDSLIRRYLQYLIEKDLIKEEEFFSFNAISEKLIDDSDIIQVLKKHKDKDERTKRLYTQIFERNYLKPLWKTPFSFRQIITDSGVQDNIMTDAKTKTEKFEKTLKEKLNLGEDDLYVVLATFKPFTPERNKNIYIAIPDKDGNLQNKRFTDIFKNTVHQEPLPDLPYIFTKPELKDKIINYLKNNMFFQ